MPLERFFFFATIVCVPTQLGKHFWPAFSTVDGIRMDYLSPTIYLTDILILLLFASWFFRQKISNKSQITNHQLLIVLLVIFLIGILFSHSPSAGLYKLLKIIEFTFLGFYIARNVSLKKDFPTIPMLLTVGILFESAITIMQFVKQGSINGLFWLFGERLFSGQTPGIANASINGKLILRPYGTFPHPNVLAGYLVIAMTLAVASIKYQVLSRRRLLLVLSLLLGTIALFLTLSRVAIALWLAVVVIWFSQRFRKEHIAILICLIVGVVLLTPLSSRFTSTFDSDRETITRRQELNTAAIEMFKRSPLVGVGLNNFLVQLPKLQKPVGGPLWLQPVHSIYLLILAETGIIGLSFFLWFVGKAYDRIIKHESRIKKRESIIHNSKFIILSLILVLGVFDHYFLTLQQGQLLFAIVFGIVWAKER